MSTHCCFRRFAPILRCSDAAGVARVPKLGQPPQTLDAARAHLDQSSAQLLGQPVQIWRSRPMPRFSGLDSHSPSPQDANEPMLARKREREDGNPSRTLVAQLLSLAHSRSTLAPRAQQTFARSTRAPSGKLLPTAVNRSHMPWQSTVTFKKPAIPSRAATAAPLYSHPPFFCQNQFCLARKRVPRR